MIDPMNENYPGAVHRVRLEVGRKARRRSYAAWSLMAVGYAGVLAIMGVMVLYVSADLRLAVPGGVFTWVSLFAASMAAVFFGVNLSGDGPHRPRKGGLRGRV